MAVESLPSAGMSVQHPFSRVVVSEGKSSDYQITSLLSLSRIDNSPTRGGMDNLPAIMIRKLPKSTTLSVVRTMLLFSKDLANVSIVESEHADDKAHVTAIAHFMAISGANEAIERLDGKTMADSPPLMVELCALPGNGRRSTVDGTAMRHVPGSRPSYSSNGVRQSSRFNNTFQNLERLSPPSNVSVKSESSNAIQNLFSPSLPTSPMACQNLNQNVGKTMINDDPSDDTGKLLSDAVAYPKSAESHSTRRLGPAHASISRFAGLSLSKVNTTSGLASPPPMSALVSPRSLGSIQSPSAAISPHAVSPLPGLGSNNSYPILAQQFHRVTYPPVNPADQNPPCNTLYVGNLPMDTSEDELKTIFSKQRGYKRLCFRVKANGPMCFVEFEDTTFATKALNELYGQPLHNSVKGGIRLSFSKNPLGVRSGQNTSNHISTHGTGQSNVVSHGVNHTSFTTATGPPPGLSVPPGFANAGMAGGLASHSVHGFHAPHAGHTSHVSYGIGLYHGTAFGPTSSSFNSMLRQPISHAIPGAPAIGAGYYGLSEYATYMHRQ